MSKDDKKVEGKFYIVPQTDEEIERNRKMIDELRAKGLLQKHEKTFKVDKDGNVTEKTKEKSDGTEHKS